ncbi:MAG: hypothetical protein R6X32_18640 [Chloroflexota bacterium]|jgi:hypothetical protein
MASSTGKNVKEKLLLLFLLASILLIGIVWVEGLTDSPPPTPAYARGVFEVEQDIYLTVTAEMQQYEQQLTATPERP